jgi:hypothetical protein
MRKVLLVFAVSAMIAIMSSCDNNNMNETNPFVGTWEQLTSANPDAAQTMTFTADFKITGYDNGGSVKTFPMPGVIGKTITWQGTYDYNGTRINIHAQNSNAPPGNISNLSIAYSFTNGILSFGGSTYSKQ